MNRTELIIVVAALLFAAFAFGWLAGWVVHRLNRVTQADLEELENLANQLHAAEEARDEAIRWGEERERELKGRIQQLEAELRAAMDGLRDARAEAEELRAYVEGLSQQG